MTYQLFLDDERFPANGPDKWVICRSFAEAKAYVEKHGTAHFWSFDHDLGYNQPTGYDFVKWLINDYHLEQGNALDIDLYNVHSMNYVGKKNIIGLIEGFLRERDKGTI